MAGARTSSDGAFPNHRLGHDPPIDFGFPRYLCGWEIPLSHGLLEEGVFLLTKEIAHTIGVLDQVAVRISGEVFGDPLQAVKEVSGVDLDESVDADIPNIGLVAVQAIADIAVLLNVLATRALVYSSLISTATRDHSVRATLKLCDTDMGRMWDFSLSKLCPSMIAP
jgi:hypothetical protein